MARDRPHPNSGSAVLEQRVSNLFHEVMPERSFDDLILPKKYRRFRMRSCRSTMRPLTCYARTTLSLVIACCLIGRRATGKPQLAEHSPMPCWFRC